MFRKIKVFIASVLLIGGILGCCSLKAFAEEVKVSDVETLEQALIDSKAGDEIVLEEGEYPFTKTLTIQNPVTLKNKGQVRLIRAAEFQNTFLKVLPTASVTIASQDGEFIFDGENQTVASLTRTGTFIDTEGGLVIDGAKFINDFAENRGQQIAPIFAKGPSAVLSFLNGEISNTNYTASNGGKNVYSAGAFYLMDGATLTMDGGVIKGGRISCFNHPSFIHDEKDDKTKWANSSSAGAVLVDTGAHFIMNGGQIEDNISYVGAVYVGTHDIYQIKRHVTDPAQLVDLDLATFEMNGGTITKNKGAGASGAVMVYANGDFTMNAGSLTENTGFQGGAILAWDEYVAGLGKGKTFAKVPFEVWSEKYPARFTMNGGQVSKNLAYACGGGIDISTNQATLNSGVISDNYAGDQGGGVYITSMPYQVQFNNAYLGDNHAKRTFRVDLEVPAWIIDSNEATTSHQLQLGAGGALWLCPTGETNFNATNGVYLAEDNHALNTGDSFFKEKNITSEEITVTLPKRNMFASPITYYQDDLDKRYDAKNPIIHEHQKDEKEAYGLKAVAAVNNDQLARQYAKLIIEGNTAYRGGGIGSNGEITFGEKQAVNLKIIKTWDESLKKHPILIELRAKFMVDEEEVDYLVETILLNEENNWCFTLEDLPKEILGHAIEDVLYLKELDSDGYNVEITKIIELAPASEGVNQLFAVTINNKEIERKNIPVEKVWQDAKGQALTKEELADLAITVELYANEEKTAKSLILNASNNWQEEFTGLEVYDEAGEVINYRIKEIAVEGFHSTIEETTTGFVITNTKDETPTPPTPKPIPKTRNIPVEKVWLGKPLASVTIELLANGEATGQSLILSDDNDWQAEFTELAFYDAKGDEIHYTIKETEVDGYTSTITGSMASGFMVVNTENTPPTPPEPELPKIPETGQPEPELPKLPETGNPEPELPKLPETGNPEPKPELPQTGTKKPWIIIPTLLVLAGIGVLVTKNKKNNQK